MENAAPAHTSPLRCTEYISHDVQRATCDDGGGTNERNVRCIFFQSFYWSHDVATSVTLLVCVSFVCDCVCARVFVLVEKKKTPTSSSSSSFVARRCHRRRRSRLSMPIRPFRMNKANRIFNAILFWVCGGCDVEATIANGGLFARLEDTEKHIANGLLRSRECNFLIEVSKLFFLKRCYRRCGNIPNPVIVHTSNRDPSPLIY